MNCLELTYDQQLYLRWSDVTKDLREEFKVSTFFL
jgi:hypothetical protein